MLIPHAGRPIEMSYCAYLAGVLKRLKAQG
jgi:hypothetical protein